MTDIWYDEVDKILLRFQETINEHKMGERLSSVLRATDISNLLAAACCMQQTQQTKGRRHMPKSKADTHLACEESVAVMPEKHLSSIMRTLHCAIIM